VWDREQDGLHLERGRGEDDGERDHLRIKSIGFTPASGDVVLDGTS
jgi:hypothetical protein